MPQISNAQLMLMIEAIKMQVGTLEKRMNSYEESIKVTSATLKQIEGYSKFIVTFINGLKRLGKWAAGILALVIAGVIVAYITLLLR